MLSPFYFIAISLFFLSACSDPIQGGSQNGPDPGLLESPIAYVKRPIPNNNGNPIQADLRDPLFFTQGGDVFIKNNSSVIAAEKNITFSVTQGMGDVKDLSPSFDGSKLLFTLRLNDENPNDDIIPRWNIYEYDVSNQTLRKIIDQPLLAEEGDDVAPAYLPDGRIVFSSNRQTQAGEMLTNEGKPRFSALDENEDTQAMTLHVMNDDGSEIHQISFNPSHDLYPIVLTHNFSGKIAFTRWDNAGSNNAMNLYTINPDGSALEVLYGVNSHQTGSTNNGDNDATIQFSRIKEMPNGSLLSIARPYTGTFDGGEPIIIDIKNFTDNQKPVFSLTGLSGSAQTPATQNKISSASNEVSLAGRYSAAFPLWDGSQRFLVSKSTCELTINGTDRPCIEPFLSDPNAQEKSPAYGIWLYDRASNTEKIVVKAERGFVFTDVIALQSRSITPAIIPDKTAGELQQTWLDNGLGVIDIRSVYDFGGNQAFNGCFLNNCTSATNITNLNDLGDPAKATADQRPARFVRFIKPVSLPDENDPNLLNPPRLDRSAFGPSRNQGMREIVGYAPVEPDGSVKVKVPANVPLAISVLDKNGQRIGPRHENWFQVKAGDTLQCVGCHTHDTASGATPYIHHRSDAVAPSINQGMPSSQFFNNTQIPGTMDAYWGNIGDTMAQARFKLATSSIPAAKEPELSADIQYQDYWTDNNVRAADNSFSYQYANLDPSLKSPASAACSPWTYLCRIVINYPQHIHPLWSVPRGVAGANTCTNCHSDKDNMGVTQVPAGQLDLSDGISDIDADQLKSYRELISNDQGQELDANGNLINIQIEVPVLDADGNPVLDENGLPVTEFIDDPSKRVSATLSRNGAISSYFMLKMTSATATRNGSIDPSDASYVDHSTFMSSDELRLIVEWLDIGVQYFNDPFDPDTPTR